MNHARRISSAATDRGAVAAYGRFVEQLDSLYKRASQAMHSNPTQAARLQVRYNRLVMEMPVVQQALSRRGILGQALEAYPMRF